MWWGWYDFGPAQDKDLLLHSSTTDVELDESYDTMANIITNDITYNQNSKIILATEKYERKHPELKFSYKWFEGKHKATIPETVFGEADQPIEIVPEGVSIEEGKYAQLSAFEQRMLHYLDAEIASQEQAI
ncbi:hypothetical protein GOBAR_DD01429 [Gossypium barbadense]|nr:hypothetical protein GOBAR_DD01429 [Gossypium barbadense]